MTTQELTVMQTWMVQGACAERSTVKEASRQRRGVQRLKAMKSRPILCKRRRKRMMMGRGD
jgi:hypothetical protein